MDVLLEKYRARFGECFPLMLCMGMSDEEINQIIQQCLDKDTMYEPDIDSDMDY